MSMTHQIAIGDTSIDFPKKLDFETQTLLRCFLTPILEQAASWDDIKTGLSQKGYGFDVVNNRLIVRSAETGAPVCTGRALGVSLSDITARLGAPV